MPTRQTTLRSSRCTEKPAGAGTQVDGEIWAVREAGRLIGSVQLLDLAPGLILIDAAVVRANARGRGIGTQMLRTILATRSAEWWLECREERIAFYERLNFSVVLPSTVPTSVASRVGTNPVRAQFFLKGKTA